MSLVNDALRKAQGPNVTVLRDAGNGTYVAREALLTRKREYKEPLSRTLMMIGGAAVIGVIVAVVVVMRENSPAPASAGIVPVPPPVTVVPERHTAADPGKGETDGSLSNGVGLAGVIEAPHINTPTFPAFVPPLRVAADPPAKPDKTEPTTRPSGHGSTELPGVPLTNVLPATQPVIEEKHDDLVNGASYLKILDVNGLPKLNLQAIAYSRAGGVALINGTTVSAGDMLGDIAVVEVQQKSVKLTALGKTFFLRMP